MRKYPIEKQVEANECGSSCLSMIIKYYKGYLPKDELKDMTKTNRNGTTAYHLVETLKEIGFDSYGIKCSIDELFQDNVFLPCIASVIIDRSYKHFIVIYEINIKKRYLIIGDPADRVKKIKYDDFKQIYNNIIICAKPNKTIPIINNQDYSFIINIIFNHKKLIIKLISWSIILTILAIVSSFFVEYILKSISIKSYNYLLYVFIIFFSINILKIIIDYIRNKLLIKINQRIDLDMTLNVFSKIIKLPYCFYRNRTTGDMISRINDLSLVRDIISRISITLFIDLPLTILVLIILFLINHLLFLLSLIIVLSYLLIVLLFRSSYHQNINKVQNNKAISNSFMVESISGFETVKALHAEENIIRKFKYKYYLFLKYITDFQKTFFLQHAFKEITNEIGFIIIMTIGSILVIKEKMTLGSLFTFYMLLSFFLQPIRNIIDLDSNIKEAKNAIKRIMEIMIKKDPDGVLNCNINGTITFKNLDFTFNDGDMILKDINLIINKGMKTMIIGKSGSGKSTLLKLLMKYYKVQNNKVFIDDMDINNISTKKINENIIYVGQEEMLFNDTIYNNIVLKDKSEEKFKKVTKTCYIDEIISSDLGYNMIIEENGFNISGGEKQRIVLARALMTDFQILIIDEGLNQVDINLERKILKNIFQHNKTKTIIVISHRLDNVDLFDQLIEMNSGTIVKNIIKNKETNDFNSLAKDNNN